MKVIGTDGREWKVFLRWLAWHPRGFGPARSLLSFAHYGFGDPVTDALRALVALIALPFLLIFLLDLLVVLLVTPLALLARSTLGRPWPVIARTEDLPEYRGTADGATAVRQLVDTVREEILRYGEPKSLTAPVIPEASLSTGRADTLPDWLNPIMEPIRRFVRQQTPPAPRSDDGQPSGRL